MSSNPNNAIGTNAAYDGRTSVNAFNDVMGLLSRGVLSGWECVPKSGMTVSIGGTSGVRDVAIAEDNNGNRTSINNISGVPVDVPISPAPASNSRIDLIVAYVDNPPTGTSTDTDNPGACGIITVEGTAAATPTAPDDSDIRAAITADGASGTTAYYVVLASLTIPSGTTDIDGTMIEQGLPASDKMTVLFSGSKQCPITLSRSANDFDMLRIFFRCNNSVYNSIDVYSPNGKNIWLATGYNDTGALYIKTQTATISGVKIDQTQNTYAYQLAIGESTSKLVVNNIWITRVEGWKFKN